RRCRHRRLRRSRRWDHTRRSGSRGNGRSSNRLPAGSRSRVRASWLPPSLAARVDAHLPGPRAVAIKHALRVGFVGREAIPEVAHCVCTRLRAVRGLPAWEPADPVHPLIAAPPLGARAAAGLALPVGLADAVVAHVGRIRAVGLRLAVVMTDCIDTGRVARAVGVERALAGRTGVGDAEAADAGVAGAALAGRRARALTHAVHTPGARATLSVVLTHSGRVLRLIVDAGPVLAMLAGRTRPIGGLTARGGRRRGRDAGLPVVAVEAG